LPLFWLRLKNRAGVFFLVVMARTLSQALLMLIMLTNGYGVPGLMAGNGAALLVLAGALLVMQTRDTGIAFSPRALRWISTYGLPIVGAELAMFALGNCNRLFMPGHIAPEVIAHFGLAARIALITALATAPFELWWFPKRIAVLDEAGGLATSARMWGLGVGIIILAGTCLALTGPVLVHVLFPLSYAGAIAYVVPLVVIQCLHVMTLFTNVGSYARANGAYVFCIETGCAAVAITGYVLLIPALGIAGVLVAMAAAQLCRMTLHLWFGRVLAPLPYPWTAAFATLAAAVVLVSIAPPHDWLIWRMLYTIVSLGLLGAVVLATGLVKLPVEWTDRIAGFVGR
jgi:O-antigen/teichoic acid export membrane protein